MQYIQFQIIIKKNQEIDEIDLILPMNLVLQFTYSRHIDNWAGCQMQCLNFTGKFAEEIE